MVLSNVLYSVLFVEFVILSEHQRDVLSFLSFLVGTELQLGEAGELGGAGVALQAAFHDDQAL